MNSIILIGRLTRDVDLKYLDSGTAIARFTIAVDRDYKNKDGTTTTDFIPIEVMGKVAENCSNYIAKGSMIAIQGNLRIDKYEKDGEKKSYTKVSANKVQFLSFNKNEKSDNTNQGFSAVDDEDIPF